jgi:hypothetical protein
MKNPSTIWLALISALVLLCTAWVRNEDIKKSNWEYSYRAIGSGIEGTPRFQGMLAEAGSEGWELVAVDREQPGGVLHFYFKRAR